MPLVSSNFLIDGRVIVITAVMAGTARENHTPATGVDMPGLLADLCGDPRFFALASVGLQARTRFVDTAGTELLTYSTEDC